MAEAGLERADGKPAEAIAERPQVPGPSVRWVFAAASAILFFRAVQDMFALNTGAPKRLQVFGTFWASGHAANSGLNPYAIYPLTWVYPLPAPFGSMLDLNLNPPVMLPLYQVLACFGPNTAVKVWTLVSVALFIGCAALLVRENREHIQLRQIVWFLLCTATFNTLWIGQNYALFVALAVVAWVFLERDQQVAAGLCLGLLIAAKPNYAVWPLLLVFSRRGRSAAVAAVTAAVLCCIPLALYGPSVYAEWMGALAGDRHWIFTTDVSLIGYAARHGHRAMGEVLAGLLLVGSLALVVWKRPSVRNTSGIALSVAILASPLAWFHYSLLLAGPLVRERWRWGVTLILFPLMFPARAVYMVSISLLAAYFFVIAAREPKAVLAETSGP